MLLGASLLLGAEQAERLREFQRWHASKPALCLTDARSIVCPVLDRSARPLLSRKGQPVTSRIILELASRTGAQPLRGASSARVLWFFIAWDERGQIAQRGTPQQILAAPADDFVRDFIGADRADRVLTPTEVEGRLIAVDGDGRPVGVLTP